MFTWIDYDETSALFIEGINTSVALLKHKDFQIMDFTTGFKVKLKADGIAEEKLKAEDYLRNLWKRVRKDIDHNLQMLSAPIKSLDDDEHEC